MNMITERHNYDNGYIGLVNLELRGLPEQVHLGEYNLTLKSEHHISIICAKRIAPIIDDENANAIESKLVEDFKDYVANKNPLIEYKLTEEYRLVRRDEKMSLVVIVILNGLVEYFEHLQNKYNIDLPLQPAHITLYTLQLNVGIGILSDEQLKNDSEVVDINLPLSKNG